MHARLSTRHVRALPAITQMGWRSPSIQCRCLQAFGWLVLLLPTHGLQRQDCDAAAWNERLGKLLALWEVNSTCLWWRQQCMSLLARMAKHDLHGALCCLQLPRHATQAGAACTKLWTDGQPVSVPVCA